MLSGNIPFLFCWQLASDVRNTMKKVEKKIMKDSGVDIIGEKLFALYLTIKEIISYRGATKPT